MIDKYAIHNFKNHADTNLELSNLNIFTGINGMGKSSVFQSMLILRDSFFMDKSLQTLRLDGDSVNVGWSAELVNRSVEKEQNILQLSMQADGKSLVFRYEYPAENIGDLQYEPTSEALDSASLKSISLFNDNFQYLSAFRSGPMTLYGSNANSSKQRQVSQKLGMGEYAVFILNKFGQEDIEIKNLKHGNSNTLKLYDQVEQWMGEISRGISFNIAQNGKDLKLEFAYDKTGMTKTYHSALNTGYGISYILSVLVAILSAKPGALILVENPEAHIHPSGQAALMKLASIAAENGVQIIMETHSDHIVNGALVNAKRGLVKRDKVHVFYFERDADLNASATLLKIEECGRIQEAPEGFFDQMDADTEVLFGITE